MSTRSEVVMNPPVPSHSSDLGGLDAAGLLRGVLGEASASWPVGGPVSWEPPTDEEAAAWFPGFTEIRLLGRGGMGAVYAARQTSLDRNVALKLLPEELSRDATAAERFRREAQALAKLNHPNIISIHDFGETPGGSFYFVMEQVEGTDLHQLIRKGELPLAMALDVVRQVCEALEYAHAQGIVHRDIKPANILIDAKGRVKVSDFGLALLVADPSSGPSPTMTQGMVGTPEYIAPEQRRGEARIDHRADLYSLGVMLYEMLTGTLPCGAFEPPSKHSEVDGKMDRVVIRAMQPEPDKRYQHASEVREDVHKAAPRVGNTRRQKAAAVLVGLFVMTGALLGWQKLRTESDATPTPQGIRTNSLGMKLVEAGTAGVLFSTLEIRRGEFGRFVEQTGYHSAGPLFFVSNGAWKSTDGSWKNPPGVSSQGDTHPVTCVSEVDASAFCQWLTARERTLGFIKANEWYRLPTEAEWRAALGPSAASMRIDSSDEIVPFDPGATALSPRDEVPETIVDLRGSVAEWTSSYGRDHGHQIVCGTSWFEIPSSAGIRHREYDRSLRGVGIGFRVVLDQTSKPENP